MSERQEIDLVGVRESPPRAYIYETHAESGTQCVLHPTILSQACK